MTTQLFTPYAPGTEGAPSYVQVRAQAAGKKVKQIVWDEAGGYPEHAWGYVQWSPRPFTQRQGCDGTIDENVHLIGMRLCAAIGLNYPTLYEHAYARDERSGESWLRTYDWTPVEAETIIPDVSVDALKGLLYDLQDINNHSFLAVLEAAFELRGYDVTDWWKDAD